MDIKKIIKWVVITVVLATLFILFVLFDPSENAYFPKCPFLVLTGYKCAGCGSQRAVHSLLNMDIIRALQENLLLVISIPYIIVGAILDLMKNLTGNALKIRNRFYGTKAIFIVLFIIISFWLFRNIFNF